MSMTGYGSPKYALSFADALDVLTLPESRGNLLLRAVPGSSALDASSCYPLFTCGWSKLDQDLKNLPADLVTLTLITDPFCHLSEAQLREIFGIVRLLSEHYVVELDNPLALSPSRHHRRKLRKASADIIIEIAKDPVALLNEWVNLYNILSRKHHIRGRRRFSMAAFAAQLAVPGAVVFGARRGGRLIGADWYFQDGERVFAHLSAYSEEGYECSVSFPMLAAAIEHFKTHACVLDLGGIPRVSASSGEGLAAFKAGWSTCRLPSYLCGMVLMPHEYRRLSSGLGPLDADFFPYYRRDEY